MLRNYQTCLHDGARRAAVVREVDVVEVVLAEVVDCPGREAPSRTGAADQTHRVFPARPRPSAVAATAAAAAATAPSLWRPGVARLLVLSDHRRCDNGDALGRRRGAGPGGALRRTRCVDLLVLLLLTKQCIARVANIALADPPPKLDRIGTGRALVAEYGHPRLDGAKAERLGEARRAHFHTSLAGDRPLNDLVGRGVNERVDGDERTDG